MRSTSACRASRVPVRTAITTWGTSVTIPPLPTAHCPPPTGPDDDPSTPPKPTEPPAPSIPTRPPVPPHSPQDLPDPHAHDPPFP
ncbi:hypothetical protein WJ438_36780 [Streptomyces sp. GD-15H]|uniref:hypothetical protein n=1 Tax=Streptomyces sp. GD-15H TaxID=3129112 RepID=UPI003245392E